MAVELGVAYISILPEMRKVAPAVRKELGLAEREAAASGKRAGAQYGKGVSAGVAPGVDKGLKDGGKNAEATGKKTGERVGKGVGVGVGAGVDKGLKDGGKNAAKSGKDTGSKFGKGMKDHFTSGAKSIYAPLAAAAVVAGTFSFFKDAITGASDLAESSSKLSNIFGTATKEVEAVASKGAKSLGMTQLQARDAASTFGVFGKAAKLTGAPLAKFSTDTTKLATDLASFHNTSPEEAIDAIGAALRGEAEPIRKYGILLDDASLRQQALSMGLIKTTKQALTPQQKVLASHALILAQSKDATNDFAETSDGLANKQRILSASFVDFRNKIGALLLPMATFATDLGVKAVDGISNLVAGLGQGEGILTRFRGVIDAVAQSPFGQWVARIAGDVIERLRPAFEQVSGTITGSLVPAFGAIVKAIGGFINSPIVGFILGVLEPVVMGFVDGVIRVITGLVSFITGVVNVIAGILTGDWSRVWEGAKQIVSGAVNVVVGIIQTGLIGRAMGALRAFGGLVGKVAGGVGSWFSTALPKALQAFIGWVQRMGSTVATFLGGWLARIVGAVFTPLRAWFTTAIPAALRALAGVFTTSWTSIGGLVTGVWGRLVAGPLTAARTWFTNLIPAALNLLRNVFTTVWNAVLSVVTGIWSRLLGGVFTPIRNWLQSTFPGAFRVFQSIATAVFKTFGNVVTTAKNVAIGAFDKIVSGMKGLGTWASTVVKGIGQTFDKIKAAIEVPVKYVVNSVIRDKLAAGWNAVAEKLNLPKWEFGGWAAGGWTGPGAKYKPAGVVHADEFVIKKESQRKLRRRHPGLLDYMNRTGQVPIPGYASGGMVYQSMAAWLRKNLPGVAITSTYRPGARTVSGNTSYHSRGMALDIAPSMRAFNAIRSAFGPSIAELIYTPAGGSQLNNGRPHVYSKAVAAQHFNHIHWAMKSPVGNVPLGAAADLDPAGGGGITNWVAAGIKAILSPLFKGARAIIDGVTGLFGSGDQVELARAMGKKPVDAVEKWLHEKIDSMFPALFAADGGGGDMAGAPPGSGVNRWSDLVLRALGMVGEPASLLPVVLRRMNQESGGDARALNGWDSNAARGTPSKGLMQVIDPTFRAYAMPGYNKNVYDPLSNILASMRYAKARYGSLSSAYNRKGGYADGGLVDHVETMDSGGILRPGVSLVRNYTGRPETVRTWEQERALGGGGTNITINGIRYDSVGEFASELNFALTRASGRSRYAGVA